MGVESARLELISRGTGEIASSAWAAQFSLEQVRDERFGLWIRRVKYHEAEFTELPLEPGGKSIYQSDSGSVCAAKLGDEVFGKVRPGRVLETVSITASISGPRITAPAGVPVGDDIGSETDVTLRSASRIRQLRISSRS